MFRVLLPAASAREFFLPGVQGPNVQWRAAVDQPAVVYPGQYEDYQSEYQGYQSIPVYAAAPEAEAGSDWVSAAGMVAVGAALGLAGSLLSKQVKESPTVAMLQVQGQSEAAAKAAWLAKQDAGFAPGAPTARYTGGVARTRGRATPAADASVLVQGGSLRTWTYRSPSVEQVQVCLSTEGRPLDADIELWHGPDNTPVKMRAYIENGQLRPFSAVIETPRGPNTVAIRNIGQIEFPIAASVVADNIDQPTPECLEKSMTIQGGALRTYPFDPTVDSVQVLLTTDGRPLNARIELLQGPNNNKQVIELYTEDGMDRPFFCFLATPGSGNVVRIVNTAPVEFPMAASVVPHAVNDQMAADAVLGGDVVIGGDVGW
jgi:hypothetical protein